MNFPSMDVKGKVAVVTGSSKGIGFGMAQGLAYYGADLVIVSRNIDEAAAAAESIKEFGGKAIALKCDVTKKADIKNMVDTTLKEFGKIDILINNAGMNIRKPLVEYEEEEYDKVIATNLKGIFLVGQAVARVMMEQKSGKIINISSIFGGVAMANQAAYASSKGGINQLTRVMAVELAPFNVNVNAIAPAYIKTPMTQGWLSDEERLKEILGSTPMGRTGELSDLVGPAVFLSSEASSFITGHILYVDGGWLAK
ncbi:glucose 1-dehydrogenase [Metallumcola ferriviriculae]|uniref:Glucose 1-dehydrogenase n=1 Tax=Metallumcola ferriviriculae TaxID=3039180 RepID=A0AAU0UNF7_9FIRM|nr:glucose 1-dehydrogenase [Desulfitibacteraceae bacterium MK1]